MGCQGDPRAAGPAGHPQTLAPTQAAAAVVLAGFLRGHREGANGRLKLKSGLSRELPQLSFPNEGSNASAA